MMHPAPSGDDAGSHSADDKKTRNAGSFAVGVIHHVPTVKELIDSIIHGAEKIMEGWRG